MKVADLIRSAGKVARVLFVLVLLLSLGALRATPASAEAGTVLGFAPDPALAVTGSSFTVDVRVQEIADFSGAQIFVDFDPSLLEVEILSTGGMLVPSGMDSLTYDNVAGTINLRLVQVGSPPVSGSGVLARIGFKAKAEGTSDLAFVSRIFYTAPLQTRLYDHDGIVIATSLADGSVTIYTAAALALSASANPVLAGQTVSFQAGLLASDGTPLGDVTAATQITSDAPGTWQGSTLTTTTTGVWLVTGTYSPSGGPPLLDTLEFTVLPGAPATVTLTAATSTLLPGGSTPVTAVVADAYSNPVADGTSVAFTASAGGFTGGAAPIVKTVAGQATVTYVASATTLGTVIVKATVGGVEDATEILVSSSAPDPGDDGLRIMLPLVLRLGR